MTVQKDGSIAHKRVFSSFEDFGLDGMRCHENGNLYVCRHGKGTVAVFSPQGVLLKEIKPER